MIATSRLKPGTAEADKDSEFKTSDEEIEDFVERDGPSAEHSCRRGPGLETC